MTSSETATVSGSHTGSNTNPHSSPRASENCELQKQTHYAHVQVFDKKSGKLIWTKKKFVAVFPTELGRGMSNLNSNWKIGNLHDCHPQYKVKNSSRKLISIDLETGDKMEFGKSKLRYKKTFEQDGSLRKPHTLNHDTFVVVRSFKKRGVRIVR